VVEVARARARMARDPGPVCRHQRRADSGGMARQVLAQACLWHTAVLQAQAPRCTASASSVRASPRRRPPTPSTLHMTSPRRRRCQLSKTEIWRLGVGVVCDSCGLFNSSACPSLSYPRNALLLFGAHAPTRCGRRHGWIAIGAGHGEQRPTTTTAAATAIGWRCTEYQWGPGTTTGVAWRHGGTSRT
jgi:hypothetical protein